MFQRLKDIEDYKGDFPLLTPKETDEILGWKHGSTYAAISNNGFLDAYLDKGKIKHPENQVKALIKCDCGALMMYKGISEAQKNAEIFEKELEALAKKEA